MWTFSTDLATRVVEVRMDRKIKSIHEEGASFVTEAYCLCKSTNIYRDICDSSTKSGNFGCAIQRVSGTILSVSQNSFFASK